MSNGKLFLISYIKISWLALVAFLLTLPMFMSPSNFHEVYKQMFFTQPEISPIYITLVVASVFDIFLGYLIWSGKILKKIGVIGRKAIIMLVSVSAQLMYALLAELLTIMGEPTNITVFLVAAAMGIFFTASEYYYET